MKKLPILLLLGLLLFPCFSYAATRTISDTGGNWSAVGTWVEGIAPTSADAVVAQADGTSGPLALDNTTNACSTLILTNYTNTMTFTAGQKLTVTTTVTFVSGMTLTGTGTLQLSNTATINSGTLTFPGDIIFDGGTWTLANNWTVTGSVTATASAANTLNSNTMNIGGSITATGSIAGTTNLVLNGTGTWSATSTTGIANNLTINTAGTITISGTVYYRTGTLTYTAGTIDNTGSTLEIRGSSVTLNTSGMSWNNVSTIGTSMTITLSSNLNITGNLYNEAIATMNGAFNVNVGGDLTTNGAYYTGTATIVLNGTGTWSATAPLTDYISCDLTINTTGTITLGTNVIYRAGTLTYVAGTIVNTNSTLIIAHSATLDTSGMHWNNVTLRQTFVNTLTLASDLICDGTFEVLESVPSTLSGAYDISCATLNVEKGATLTLVASQTLTASTNLYINGSGVVATTIQSTVASNATNLVYQGTAANCKVFAATFTDIDASGSAQGIDNWYGGTLTRTTNITNRTSADIGGGGGGSTVGYGESN